MFRAISSATSAWRPRISAQISIVVVLTITSACLIFVTVRQHALLRQRVRFFFLMEAL